MSARTEQPTPKRLAEARRKGDVPRSRMAAASLAALGGFAALAAAAPGTARAFVAYARWALGEGAWSAHGASLPLAQARAVEMLARASLPAAGAAAAAALLGAALQVGLKVNPSLLAPKLSRVNPARGLRRLFSTQALAEGLRALVAAAVAVGVAWTALRNEAAAFAALPSRDGLAAYPVAFESAFRVGFRVLVALALLGGLDFLWQRASHRRRLRMTRDELRRELKESEGDPHSKARRKALHRALANGSAARGVQKATVVVVNPTHLAVALRYEPAEASAPVIVAKGREDEALRLRQLARWLHVPIVRDVPLARALFPFDVGEEIPEELYEAAAVVLRKVYSLGAARPEPPPPSPSPSSPPPPTQASLAAQRRSPR